MEIKTPPLSGFLIIIPEVPDHVLQRLTFENDDKTYTLEETLAVSKRLHRPCMLDLHHDWCNPSTVSPIELLPALAKTWGDIPMRIHVSSPKDEKEFRSHSEYSRKVVEIHIPPPIKTITNRADTKVAAT